ncbi:hypothetical protein CRE_16990 [Caenorhabditis remanei]|uniref:Sdz-33 F-box domain-containing protein n=1 Tax=Caenorhabditis remanei TaxID=31234 RepID=E3N2F8_CAERE|nr:hypothetical protein CRE_16990 [Caenorhabditis remanei]
MSTVFHLFSLPYVPLKQVLDNFGPEALIIFSLCSLKSKRIAVSYRGPSKRVQLKLQFGSWDCLQDSKESYGNILLTVEETEKLPMDETLETVRIGSFEKVAVKMKEGFVRGENLVTYWENRMTGLTEIGDYAREVFNQDIYEVLIFDKRADDDHRRAAEWVTKSQKSVQSLHCEFKLKVDNDLDCILENFKYTEKLELLVKPSEHFCPAKTPNFQIETWYLWYSYWIKQHHLLAMDCKYIWLYDSELTTQDFNVFLKHWLAGGCSKLIELRVVVEQAIDYAAVLDGVEFTERGRDVERVYVDEERTPHTMKGGFDVKRSNVTATIVDRHPVMFWIIVW